jgi:hypothetical protein
VKQRGDPDRACSALPARPRHRVIAEFLTLRALAARARIAILARIAGKVGVVFTREPCVCTLVLRRASTFRSIIVNPFKNRALSLGGPATDILPVTPSDSVDLPMVAPAMYVETGGNLVIVTVAGQTRTVKVADYSVLAVGVSRVKATGTTATGIHALVLA